jgi:hypothetical protein
MGDKTRLVMRRSGQSVFGYRLMMFILLVGILFLAVIAFYLNNNPVPGRESEVIEVIVTPTDVDTLIPTAVPLAEQLQTDLDELKILRLLFGEDATYQFSDLDGKAEAKWVPAADSLGPFPANGARAYLTRVLQIGLPQDGVIERVLVFTQSAPSPALSTECQMVPGVAELRFQEGAWVRSAWQPALPPEEGRCGLPTIEALAFGEEEHGFIFHHSYEQKGETIQVDEFYKPSQPGYTMVFNLETYHDNGRICPPGCYSTLVDYEWLPAETGAIYDLQVHTRGTHLVDGEVVVVNQTQLYTFQEGVYRAAEEEGEAAE